MDSFETRRKKLNLTFAKKCLKIERMKHDMKIRDSLKYKVTKAKKERYKKSSVISMQKLLNSEYKKPCKQGTVHKLVPNP